MSILALHRIVGSEICLFFDLDRRQVGESAGVQVQVACCAVHCIDEFNLE